VVGGVGVGWGWGWGGGCAVWCAWGQSVEGAPDKMARSAMIVATRERAERGALLIS